MVNKLLNAVTKQLGTTFGDEYRYYVENVEQDLKEPCFTVDMLIPLQRSRSPLLYDRTMPIVVHYFSDSKHFNKNDCYAMGERIIESLEYLPFEGGLIRGDDINYQIVDDILQVFITYKLMTIRETEQETTMEDFSETVTHTD